MHGKVVTKGGKDSRCWATFIIVQPWQRHDIALQYQKRNKVYTSKTLDTGCTLSL